MITVQTGNARPRHAAPTITRLRAVLLLFAVALCLALMPARQAAADELAQPSGRVILTVEGNISTTNAGDSAQFDRALLESLGTHRVVTGNPWVDGEVEFEGVLVSRLLEAVGAGSQRFKAVALDGYAVEVKGIDFAKYPVLLALKMDGKYMSVRNKGPLWIIVPFSDHPELDVTSSRYISIWQLTSISVR